MDLEQLWLISSGLRANVALALEIVFWIGSHLGNNVLLALVLILQSLAITVQYDSGRTQKEFVFDS